MSDRPTFAVIFAAAGRGSRFSSAENKVLRRLSGTPVWQRSVLAFARRPDIVQRIVVVSEGEQSAFLEDSDFNAQHALQFVTGGASRAASVFSGLTAVHPGIDFVAVHDAARPLVSDDDVDSVFRAAAESGAAILAEPVTSTVKIVEGDLITETLPRENLVAAQTPQVFGKSILAAAYARRGNFQPTDEAQLVSQAGIEVRIVRGSHSNIKITHAADLAVAEALIAHHHD